MKRPKHLLKSINKNDVFSSPLILPWGSSECSEEKNSQHSSPRCRSGLGVWFNPTFGRKFLGLLSVALHFHLCFLSEWKSHRMHLQLESSISSIFPLSVRLLWDHLGVPHLCGNSQLQEASLPPTCAITQCSLLGKCGKQAVQIPVPSLASFMAASSGKKQEFHYLPGKVGI